MPKVVRILTKRKYKKVTFFDVSEKVGTHIQLICQNNFLDNIMIKVGDIINFEGKETTTQNGNSIIEIIRINWVNHPLKWVSSKGLNDHTKSSFEEIQISSRNAGKQIILWKCQYQFKAQIRSILNNDNFLEYKCKAIEEKRTSAIRKPLAVVGENVSQSLYLRITMENQLKQACAILLNSVYSLDTVFYDKFVNSNVDREVCILEFVSLEYDYSDLLRFIKNLDSVLRTLFIELNLEAFGYSVPDTLQILDFNEFSNDHVDYSELDNAIITNVPVNSPFIDLDSNGNRKELQWIVRGKMLGHGYKDEFDFNALIPTVETQMKQLNLTDCNKMNYMNYGIPRTFSFGLGIDQLLYRFYNLEHIINISNPLGIYFD